MRLFLVFMQPEKKRGVRKLKVLRFHIRGYIEIGFSSVVAAMLAPMLAACGLSASLTWRWASAIIAVGLVAHILYALKRFVAIGHIPIHFQFNSTITALIILSLIANSSGFLIEPSAGPVVVAATWRAHTRCRGIYIDLRRIF